MERQRRLRLRPLLVVLAVAHLVFGAIVGLRAFGWLQALELLAYDGYLGWRVAAAGGPPEERILVVGITAEDALGDTTVSDRVLAEALERLVAMEPVAIGLDLLRNVAVPPGREALERVLRANGTIVVTEGYADTPESGLAIRAAPAVVEDPARIGFADMPDDPDDVLRRGFLYLTGGERHGTSLALRLAERYLAPAGIVPTGDAHGHLRLGATSYPPLAPDDGGYVGLPPGGYQFLLTYPACTHPLPTVPIGRLLDGGVGREQVAGRVVLVGNLLRDARDVFQAPVACASPDPARVPREIAPPRLFGVEVHARITSQLIREALGEARPILTPGQLLRRPALGELAEHAWIWLWTIGGGLIAWRARGAARLALGAVAGPVALLATTFAAFLTAGWWLPVVPPLLGGLAALAIGTGSRLAAEALKRARLMRLFGAYVSPHVARTVWRDDDGEEAGIAPRELIATVLFSDIRGSTAIAERLAETELMAWLNEYMAEMADLVLAHGGSIEKFAGDGITAAFGVPEARTAEDEIGADARAATDSALAMGRALARLNAAWAARGLPAIGMRVGIHTGPLIIGNLGSERRMQYSLIGDTANTAARLESWRKDEPSAGGDADHCRILVSAATWRWLEGDYAGEPVGALQLRGKQRPLEVYRVLGRTPRPAEAKERVQS